MYQILDTVLLANKFLEWKLQKQESGNLCKLDIEKAYDLVNWECFFQIMRKMGFNERWVGWICYCSGFFFGRSYCSSSIASFSVLVNRGNWLFQNQQRSKAGDPLSLFLFII